MHKLAAVIASGAILALSGCKTIHIPPTEADIKVVVAEIREKCNFYTEDIKPLITIIKIFAGNIPGVTATTSVVDAVCDAVKSNKAAQEAKSKAFAAPVTLSVQGVKLHGIVLAPSAR